MGQKLLYFRRSFAQSNVVNDDKIISTLHEKQIVSSVNAEKIADATRYLLQNQHDYAEFKYDNLVKVAKKDLESTFERLGLNNPLSKNEKKIFDRKKRIAIANWMENYIRKNFPNVLKIDFDTFIKSTGIKAAQGSVSKALKVLKDVQNTNFYEIEHLVLNLQTGEIETRLSRVSALPSISITLDESVAGKYTLSSFADAKIKNKRALIKGLEIEFSTSYLFHVLSIGTEYVVSDKVKREEFRHIASFKMDILLSSIYGIQYNKEAATFSIDELKDKFGVKQDVEYRYFKRDVLNRAVEELKNKMGKIVTMQENKVGRKVVSITFSIKYKTEEPLFEFIYEYIASQLFYFYDDIEIQNIKKFANFLKTKKNEDEFIGKKTLLEWREEAELAFKNETELLKMMEDDKPFFNIHGFVYDKAKHTLLSKVTDFQDGEEIVRYEIISHNNKKVTNPIDSLRYIIDLENENMMRSVHIADIIPFAYYKLNTWIDIDSIDMLLKHQESIYKDILLKDVDKFAFEDETRKQMFNYYVSADKFAETTKGLKQKIQRLFDL